MDSYDIKKDFPLLQNRDIAYLDSGATTQKPKQVIELVKDFYENNNANPHRGAYTLSMEATSKYEETRSKIAKFINARKPEEIIFSKNASESLNLIAYSYGLDNLKEDDEVCISILEHHSNLVPWQRICDKTKSKLKYMYINENYEIPDEEIEAKITDKTDWEKYRYLFMMHLNLKLIEQHLRLGRIYDKQVAYFYDAPWKEEYLRDLEKTLSCYKICYTYCKC